MLIKVKTLTGKEIEIDIEPNDKVERIKERVEEKVKLERFIRRHFQLLSYKQQRSEHVFK
jgi:hypothetical protein